MFRQVSRIQSRISEAIVSSVMFAQKVAWARYAIANLCSYPPHLRLSRVGYVHFCAYTVGYIYPFRSESVSSTNLPVDFAAFWRWKRINSRRRSLRMLPAAVQVDTKDRRWCQCQDRSWSGCVDLPPAWKRLWEGEVTEILQTWITAKGK